MDNGNSRSKLLNLLGEQPDVATGGKSENAETGRVESDYIKRAGADRTGGTKNRQGSMRHDEASVLLILSCVVSGGLGEQPLKPLRAPGRLLQGSFSLEVSLALVGVNYLPGLLPIIEGIIFGINQKMYIIFGTLCEFVP
jgi:hypothetical protein